MHINFFNITKVLFLIVILGISNFGVAKASEEILKINEKAWRDFAYRAGQKEEVKYAIYHSRSLAVKHPEIYLQADVMFSNNQLTKGLPHRIVEKSTWDLYQERTTDLIQQKEIFEEILSKKGRVFSWGRFDFSQHKETSYEEIYRTDSFLPFLNLRFFFLGSALKGTDWKAPPVNLAQFLYFEIREGFLFNLRQTRPFILIDEKLNAYVYRPGTLFSDKKLFNHFGQGVEKTKEDVFLIFNEEVVWYPLMERDDRNKCANLRKAVEVFGEEGNLPKLKEVEKKIVEILRENTKLKNENEKKYAQKFAGRFHAFSWAYFEDLFSSLYPRYREIAGFNRTHAPGFISYRHAYISRLSGQLSPSAALFASIARENKNQSLDYLMRKVTEEIYKYVGTMTRGTGLQLWFHSELFFLNFDDNMLTKGGNCIMNAANIASIIDLAKIKSFEALIIGMKYARRSGGHANALLFKGRDFGVVDSGRWLNESNGLTPGTNGGSIGYVTTGEGWVSFATEKSFGIKEINYSIETNQVRRLLELIKQRSRNLANICITFKPARSLKTERVGDFISGSFNELKKNPWNF